MSVSPEERQATSPIHNGSGRHGIPGSRHLGEWRSLGRPLMQSCRVKVRPVRPHQGMHLGIECDLIEQPQIAEWSVQFPVQNGQEIDDLLRAVVKPDAQNVGREDFKAANPADEMRHMVHSISTVRWAFPCVRRGEARQQGCPPDRLRRRLLRLDNRHGNAARDAEFQVRRTYG